MGNKIKKLISLKEFCNMLLISEATGKNWIKLGKIQGQKFINNKPFFTDVYCRKFINYIKKSDKTILKSRRNKMFKSGFNLYKSYLSHDSENMLVAQNLINYCEKSSFIFSEPELKEIIAYYAKEFINQRFGDSSDLYKHLVDDICISENITVKYPWLKNIQFKYDSTDILGLIYQSLNNISQKKTQGAYYTPTVIINKLIQETFKNYRSGNIIDPCCGSGNFILQLPFDIPYQNIYAADIDELSVKITRINFALKYGVYDKDFIYKHIKVQNFLNTNETIKYDYIIGNPPWAYNFNESEKKFLRKKYKTAQNTNIESFDVITEQALNKLNNNGILSFILPESLLNVKSHKLLREIIMQKSSFKYLEYLGESFDGVLCPSIILKLFVNNKPMNTLGLRVKTKESEFIINTDRKLDVECFNFTSNDEEYYKLLKIDSIPNKVTLKGKAVFALGIVTGDNKKYISKYKNNKNEFILKGSDIEKFKIKNPRNYIVFNPDDFQQCAPEEIYRTKEKLLYKFISKDLVFAYDDRQILTLNSCNILIPKINGLNIKYILGVLNSDLAQFYFKKKFNSIKVLRSHVEQIPIPYVDINKQNKVIEIVDKILESDNNLQKLYKELNNICNSLYGL